MSTTTETMVHSKMYPRYQYLSIALNAVKSLLYEMEHRMSAPFAVLRISMSRHIHIAFCASLREIVWLDE